MKTYESKFMLEKEGDAYRQHRVRYAESGNLIVESWDLERKMRIKAFDGKGDLLFDKVIPHPYPCETTTNIAVSPSGNALWLEFVNPNVDPTGDSAYYCENLEGGLAYLLDRKGETIFKLDKYEDSGNRFSGDGNTLYVSYLPLAVNKTAKICYDVGGRRLLWKIEKLRVKEKATIEQRAENPISFEGKYFLHGVKVGDVVSLGVMDRDRVAAAYAAGERLPFFKLPMFKEVSWISDYGLVAAYDGTQQVLYDFIKDRFVFKRQLEPAGTSVFWHWDRIISMKHLVFGARNELQDGAAVNCLYDLLDHRTLFCWSGKDRIGVYSGQPINIIHHLDFSHKDVDYYISLGD